MKSRKSKRKQNFNYANEGIYFITTCCKERIHHFGEVKNDEMHLNEFGIIAHNQILWLERQYPYLDLHNFIVMPNHVHILFEIAVGTGRDLSSNTANRTGRDLSLPKIKSVS